MVSRVGQTQDPSPSIANRASPNAPFKLARVRFRAPFAIFEFVVVQVAANQ
jgi:hypothetical protein